MILPIYKVDNFTVTAKVKDFVAVLLTLDQEALVFTEGCDCTGNVVAVSVEKDGSVTIERDDMSMRHGVVNDRYKEFYRG